MVAAGRGEEEKSGSQMMGGAERTGVRELAPAWGLAKLCFARRGAEEENGSQMMGGLL